MSQSDRERIPEFDCCFYMGNWLCASSPSLCLSLVSQPVSASLAAPQCPTTHAPISYTSLARIAS